MLIKHISSVALMMVLAGCRQAPYKIIDRSVEGPMDIVVKVRADVPATATKAEMESWCATIAENEGKDKVVSVEFLEEGPIVTQKGLCVGKEVFVP